MSSETPDRLYHRHVFKERSQKLFGVLLRLLCKRAGIRQDKLERDSRDYIDYLRTIGRILEEDSVDVSQTTISDVMRGKRLPTLDQLDVWFEVIHHVYDDPAHKERCEKAGVEVSTFPPELEIAMHRIAHCGTRDEMFAAYEKYVYLVSELPARYRNGLIAPEKPKNTNELVKESDSSTDDQTRYVHE